MPVGLVGFQRRFFQLLSVYSLAAMVVMAAGAFAPRGRIETATFPLCDSIGRCSELGRYIPGLINVEYILSRYIEVER